MTPPTRTALLRYWRLWPLTGAVLTDVNLIRRPDADRTRRHRRRGVGERVVCVGGWTR